MCSDTNTCRQLRDYIQTMHVKPRMEKRVEEFHDPEDDVPSAAFMLRRRLRNYLKWKREFAQVSATLFSENQKALSGAVDPRLRQSKNRAPANKRRRLRGGGCVGTAAGRLDNGTIAQYFEKPAEVAELMA